MMQSDSRPIAAGLLARSRWNFLSIGLFIVVLLVMLFHGGRYLSGYYFSVTENFPDEVFMVTNSAYMRNGQTDKMNLLGYPPGIFWVHDAIQAVLRLQHPGSGADEFIREHILAARLLAVLVNMGSGVLIYLITSALTEQPAAGVLAGAVWAASPLIIERAVLGLTEPWQHFFILLSLICALQVISGGKARYALLSIAAALGAITFKYTAFPALLFGVSVPVWYWLHDRTRKRALYLLGGQIVLIAMYFVWIVFLYGAFQLSKNPEPARFLSGNLGSVFGPAAVLRNFEAAASMMNVPFFLFGAAIVLGIVFFIRTSLQSWKSWVWIVILVCTGFYILFINTYLVYEIGLLRYLLPVSGLLLVLTVVPLYQIFAYLVQNRSSRHLLTTGALIALGIVWLAQPLQINFRRLASLYPDPKWEFVNWTQTSLKPGKTLFLSTLDPNLWILFDGYRGGYQGPVRPYVVKEDFTKHSIGEWRDLYVHYALLYKGDLDSLKQLVNNPLDDMPLLKQFGRGQDKTYLYTLDKPQHAADITFGGTIHMIGYNLDIHLDSTAANGRAIRFQPYWKADAPPKVEYHVFVHLVPQTERAPIAQADGLPALPGRPTTSWDDPAEIIVGAEYAVALPDELEAGQYRLVVGLYDPVTGSRLQTGDGLDYLLVSEIEIPRNST